MTTNTPITWVPNPRARTITDSPAVEGNFPEGVFSQTRAFHRQIPGYKPSPLRSLSGLASMIGVGGIWVKDESVRLDLNSFKVLGGSFAIYRFIKQQLGREDEDLSFEELISDETRAKLGEITFATATDGNHGRGVAWAASQLKCRAVIYVHKDTSVAPITAHESKRDTRNKKDGNHGRGVAWAASQLRCRAVIYVHKDTSVARIRAIESYGAEVHIVDGTYDDAVHLASQEADANGWQVISDTSWEGYEDIPRWVMQGYTTMLTEAQEQLAGTGIIKPTHVFVQAGVGALAAAVTGFYASRFGADRPTQVVVEPATADCLYQSARIGDGTPHDIEGDLQTIMAGLACGEPSPIAWGVLWDAVDAFVASPDYVAAKGMRMYGVPLAGDPFIVSGESGAVTLGALTFIAEDPSYADLKEYLGLGPDSQILLINSEGNTDPDYFRRVVWEGADSVPDEYRKVLAGISQNS